MAALKPWYQVAIPREDLRMGQPLDASEFAIHLDQVMDGRAPRDYREPERFFNRTYLTATFSKLTVEVMRRLSGDLVGTSPGINLTTQFGGGKTHFLTLLYHLFRAGDAAKTWTGVNDLMTQAGIETVPLARVATFIGNRFDFVVGVGAEGEPKRKTPWGDIAWQLGGPTLFNLVEQHDWEGVVPGGEIIQQFFTGEPTLILMDEALSFIRRSREAGDPYTKLGSQFYSFLDVLTREVAGNSNVVLVVSLPLSEYEMTREDEAEFQRLDKMLDRLSKAVLLSEQMEIAEIVRRRLFEDIGDPNEVRRAAKEYAEWVVAHHEQLPGWFSVDQAAQVFEATYPFHPTVLSVFERKWQSLPNFQRTRGILRLLALWVSQAYREGFTTGQKDSLLGLGSAPLGDSLFRAAIFEQLGELRLEGAITADIAGEEANAVQMDRDAPETIGGMRLHQKVATTVFFESSGGQVRNEATLPEVRLAVGEPDLDIGNVETVLDDLVRRCYYLDVKGSAYWVSHRSTLNKILADRRAMLSGEMGEEAVREKVREAIRRIFGSGPTMDRRYFPEASADLPDTPSLILVILSPDHSWESSSRENTKQLVSTMIQEYGSRGRTFKSGLLFAVGESYAALADEAKTLLAIESLEDPVEQERRRLEPSQIQELREKKGRSERDLKENVWHAYRRLLLLAEDGDLREIDLGVIHSSAAESLVGLIIARLRQEGLLEESISPDFLVRNWPPALTEWCTKAVRDAFFATPRFPRLLNAEVIKETIARGVSSGTIAYVGKSGEGDYEPFYFEVSMVPNVVEISDQMFIITAEEAKKHIRPKNLTAIAVSPQNVQIGFGGKQAFIAKGLDQDGREVRIDKVSWEAKGGIIDDEGVFMAEQNEGSFVVTATVREVTGLSYVSVSEGTIPPPPLPPPTEARSLSWTGEIPPQKWMNFYTRVLTRFATDPSLRLRIQFDVTPESGITQQQVEETQMALRDLGLSDTIESSESKS